MVSELPETIECRLLAAGSGELSGTVGAARLARIDKPYRVSGVTQVHLRCTVREGGGYELWGRIAAPLEALCQRCLEWMSWPVEAELALVALNKAPLTQHDEELDWIELADGILPLREILEDEVLLNCPSAPLHGLAECKADKNIGSSEVAGTHKQPFADLANLLKRPER